MIRELPTDLTLRRVRYLVASYEDKEFYIGVLSKYGPKHAEQKQTTKVVANKVSKRIRKLVNGNKW